MKSLLLPIIALLAAMPLASASGARKPATAQMTPASDVYIVTSREHFLKHGALFGTALATRVGKDAQPLVIARLKQYQLDDLGHAMHEREQVCGGYFAFESQAAAEAFIKSGRAPQPGAWPAFHYAIDSRAVVQALMPEASESNIYGTVNTLSTTFPNRYYNSDYGRDASNYIRDTWRALAGGRHDVTVEQVGCDSPYFCGLQQSVILTIRGSRFPGEIVVLGGHMDSVSNSGTGNGMNAPGADDDASGIATLTEILRVAMANGYRPHRTVKFMAYAAEEVGLRGSRSIAQSFALRKERVAGVLQLDMTNYRTGNVDMRIVTDFSSEPLKAFFAALFDTYLAPLGYTRGTDTCGYACSDHASWTQYGFPAAMMFEGGDANGNYFPNIHRVSDRIENMGGTTAPSVPFARFGLAFMAEMGKGSIRNGSVQGDGPRPPTPLPGRR